jgi:hypothetical protein
MTRSTLIHLTAFTAALCALAATPASASTFAPRSCDPATHLTGPYAQDSAAGSGDRCTTAPIIDRLSGSGVLRLELKGHFRLRVRTGSVEAVPGPRAEISVRGAEIEGIAAPPYAGGAHSPISETVQIGREMTVAGDCRDFCLLRINALRFTLTGGQIAGRGLLSVYGRATVRDTNGGTFTLGSADSPRADAHCGFDELYFGDAQAHAGWTLAPTKRLGSVRVAASNRRLPFAAEQLLEEIVDSIATSPPTAC